jgi:hypothetical protein
MIAEVARCVLLQPAAHVLQQLQQARLQQPNAVACRICREVLLALATGMVDRIMHAAAAVLSVLQNI